MVRFGVLREGLHCCMRNHCKFRSGHMPVLVTGMLIVVGDDMDDQPGVLCVSSQGLHQAISPVHVILLAFEQFDSFTLLTFTAKHARYDVVSLIQVKTTSREQINEPAI